MFKNLKAKAKATKLQPRIMKRFPKYTGISKPELRKMLVQKLKEKKQINDQGKMTQTLIDEYYVDETAIALAYHEDQMPLNPTSVSNFMLECAKEAGFDENETS